MSLFRGEQTALRLRGALFSGDFRHQPVPRLPAGMRIRLHQSRIILPLLLGVFGIAACNLVSPTTLTTPVPTAALPHAQILFPAHNQQVVEGVIFDIEILASDAALGVQRVELYVDEQLQQTAASETGGVSDYRVTMNWFAKEAGWHKFAVIAYRADGAASHAHTIALEVIPPA